MSAESPPPPASAARVAALEKRVADLEKRLAGGPAKPASKYSRVIVWGSVFLVLFVVYFLMNVKLF